jgi:hypothetical protein
MAPFTALILALSALSYRYIEFGHRRDWKALFLLGNTEAQPQIASTPLPLPSEWRTSKGEIT